MVIFWRTDVVISPSSRRRTKTSRNGSAPSFSSSSVNCTPMDVELRWILKSACLTLLIISKLSSAHLARNDGILGFEGGCLEFLENDFSDVARNLVVR